MLNSFVEGGLRPMVVNMPGFEHAKVDRVIDQPTFQNQYFDKIDAKARNPSRVAKNVTSMTNRTDKTEK